MLESNGPDNEPRNAGNLRSKTVWAWVVALLVAATAVVSVVVWVLPGGDPDDGSGISPSTTLDEPTAPPESAASSPETPTPEPTSVPEPTATPTPIATPPPVAQRSFSPGEEVAVEHPSGASIQVPSESTDGPTEDEIVVSIQEVEAPLESTLPGGRVFDFSIVDEDTVRMWTFGSRSSCACPTTRDSIPQTWPSWIGMKR